MYQLLTLQLLSAVTALLWDTIIHLCPSAPESPDGDGGKAFKNRKALILWRLKQAYRLYFLGSYSHMCSMQMREDIWF